VGQVSLDGGAADLAVERFTSNGPLALLPLPAHPAGLAPPATRRAALVWCVPLDDDPVAPLDDSQRIALLNALLPAVAGRVVQLSALKRIALGLNAETTLVRGRTVRIGNAAQTLHPVAGQGLNLGLRDAWDLAQALHAAEDPGSEHALARFAAQRRLDAAATMGMTEVLARGFLGANPLARVARGAVLTSLDLLPAARRFFARRMIFGPSALP
jgi:2-octaprenyl-6-methoxyphenol hydroxylase